MLENQVIRLVDKTDNARNYSTEEMLKDAIKDEKALNSKKAIFIYLEDEPDDFKPAYYLAGMKNSEVIALLDFAKHLFLNRLSNGEGW